MEKIHKRFEQVFKKGGNPNGHKCMKICLTLSIIKERKIKTTIRKKLHTHGKNF